MEKNESHHYQKKNNNNKLDVHVQVFIQKSKILKFLCRLM